MKEKKYKEICFKCHHLKNDCIPVYCCKDCFNNNNKNKCSLCGNTEIKEYEYIHIKKRMLMCKDCIKVISKLNKWTYH